MKKSPHEKSPQVVLSDDSLDWLFESPPPAARSAPSDEQGALPNPLRHRLLSSTEQEENVSLDEEALNSVMQTPPRRPSLIQARPFACYTHAGYTTNKP